MSLLVEYNEVVAFTLSFIWVIIMIIRYSNDGRMLIVTHSILSSVILGMSLIQYQIFKVTLSKVDEVSYSASLTIFCVFLIREFIISIAESGRRKELLDDKYNG